MIVELNVLILYFPTIFASSYLFDSSLFNSCCFMFYQTFESLIFSVLNYCISSCQSGC